MFWLRNIKLILNYVLLSRGLDDCLHVVTLYIEATVYMEMIVYMEVIVFEIMLKHSLI